MNIWYHVYIYIISIFIYGIYRGNVYVFKPCLFSNFSPPHEWVMSHIWMSHVTHMNEPCHTHEWVMSHISIGSGHVTHIGTQQPGKGSKALQCTATYCNTLQHPATHCNALQHTTTHCNTHCNLRTTFSYMWHDSAWETTAIWQAQQSTATYWNIPQHTATQYSTRSTVSYMQHDSTYENTVVWQAQQRTATHCNILQYTATRCNTLQQAHVPFIHETWLNIDSTYENIAIWQTQQIPAYTYSSHAAHVDWS